MCHATFSFQTMDSVVTKGFLSSAPKTSKRTRRPRPKHKTTPTSEAPKKKLGNCGFLVKGVVLEALGSLGLMPEGEEIALVIPVLVKALVDLH